MLGVLLVVLGILTFEVLVWRYGVDSRDGADWIPPNPRRNTRSTR